MLKLAVHVVRRLDWTISFWRFALLFFLTPWSGVIACSRMRRDGRPWPLLLRLSFFATTYLLLGLQVLITWVWIWMIVRAEWVAVVILPFAALSNLFILVMRLQTIYKFSRQTAAAAR